MNEYDYCLDLTQRAIAAGMDFDWATTCGVYVYDKMTSGRGFDCDEFRALTQYANQGGN